MNSRIMCVSCGAKMKEFIKFRSQNEVLFIYLFRIQVDGTGMALDDQQMLS